MSTNSPAFRVALSIAVILEPCSLAAFSRKALKICVEIFLGNKLFNESQFDVCKIFYNKFKNVITQVPQEQQLIPIENEKKEKEKDKIPDNFYEFEPEENEILNDLLPRNISTQIFKAFLENAASEQGSRMTAMDSATRNAGDLIDRLTINYNRSRQAAITKELIEIISGAESL